MGAGRPTLYNQKYCQEIVDYFSGPLTKKITEQQVSQGRVVEVEKEVMAEFPTLAGFAAKIGVCKDTINEWANVHEEFSVAKKKCKALQEQWLVNNGMLGKVNTAFGIFVAKNVLGYKDKIETDNTNREVKIVIDSDDEKL